MTDHTVVIDKAVSATYTAMVRLKVVIAQYVARL